MPFTLAHPAAVLPLRKFCPVALNFPALFMGSLTPDVGYFFGRLNVDEYSHSLVGSVVFGLPVGGLILAVFYGGRSAAVKVLPARHREVLQPLCERPAGSLWIMFLSLLVGVWTHLALDSFTHKGGWLVERLSLMRQPVLTVGYHNLRVHHLAWYGCSFGGIAWICFVYDRWLRRAESVATASSVRVSLRDALLVASLLVPIELLHHSVGGLIGIAVVAALSLLVAGIAAWRLGRPLALLSSGQ